MSHLIAFKRQHEVYESADTLQKCVWVFAAVIFIPMLAVIDSATLHLFFEFLGGKVEGGVKTFLAQYGFMCFITIEMMVSVFLIYNRIKRDEGEAGWFGTAAIIGLMMIIAIFPSLLIAGGFYLNPTRSMEDLVKVAALIVFSLIIHFSIFLFSEILWHAIAFCWFCVKSLWFDITNPKSRLANLTVRLRKLHLEYKHNLDEYRALPAKDQEGFDPTLGKRESWLMNKLTHFNDEDFNLDDIEPSPVIIPPDNGGKAGGGTATPSNQAKIGFKYTYTNTTL